MSNFVGYGTSLTDFIILRKRSGLNQISESQAQNFALRLLNCIDHLHRTCGIVHANISSDKVIMEYESDGDLEFKIVDFGTADFLGEDRPGHRDPDTKNLTGAPHAHPDQIDVSKIHPVRVTGSPAASDPPNLIKFQEEVHKMSLFTSPELLKGQDYDGKVDVWSACVLIYLLITLVPPFKGNS